jgi:hypothetical protein
MLQRARHAAAAIAITLLVARRVKMRAGEIHKHGQHLGLRIKLSKKLQKVLLYLMYLMRK